jgi:hypothetical protein
MQHSSAEASQQCIMAMKRCVCSSQKMDVTADWGKRDPFISAIGGNDDDDFLFLT